ncbi:ribosomal subunit interface protein [PVC group bacterium (ex Bugula neritina AB1)]|nr:ribosomal subunit interface protein [PVC group bacterium (ex Bugula neritina AB1)]
MNINISGRNLDLTDGLHHYIHHKIEKLENVLDNLSDCKVTLSIQKKHSHIAEISLFVNKEYVKGISDSKDMYISIDQAVEKVFHHLQKIRDKIKHHRKLPLKHEMKILTEQETVSDESFIEEFIETSQTVPVKEYLIRSMTLEEALMQYKNLKAGSNEEDFLIFRQIDTKKISLLKKNTSNEIELIEAVDENI